MSVGYYADLLQDPERIEGFRAGLRAEIRPGDRVLEIGTGLGTYAFFAAQSGASHVWAVDRAPVVHLAESIALVNGLADRITWLRGDVPDVDLPESVDLIIFEDFPIRLLDDRIARLLRDASAKYLAPGGRLFPRMARWVMAPVYGDVVEATIGVPPSGEWDAWGIDWSPLSPYLSNLPRTTSLPVESLACEPVVGPDAHLLPGRTEPWPRLEVRGSWSSLTTTEVQGIALWFDLALGEGGWYGNGPDHPDPVWGQTLLPVIPSLHVPPGAPVSGSVRSDPLADGAPGWLSWEIECAGEVRTGHEFAGEPASLRDLLDEE